jgi:hypothetical protein
MSAMVADNADVAEEVRMSADVEGRGIIENIAETIEEAGQS